MSNNILIKEFDGQEVGFRTNSETGQEEVRINEVAKFCGWTYLKNNKEYTRFNTINGFLKELGFSQDVAKGDFIPEYIMYALIGKAKNESATKFMLWVGKVLVDIRKHGAYIAENADEEYVKNELRFSTGRVIKTFGNANVSEIKQLYDDFKDYTDEEYKHKTSIRISRYKSVEKGLQALHDNTAKADIGNIGNCYNIQQLKQQVILDRTKIEKKSLGGDKGGKTREINKLQEQIDNSPNYPTAHEYVTLDCHGFSINYMYKYSVDGTYKSDAYKMWIKYFPMDQVPEMDYWEDIDFSEPIELFINYVAKADVDTQNMDKSFIDMIFNTIYEVDDNIVEAVHSQKVATVDNYQDGKISFFIRNI